MYKIYLHTSPSGKRYIGQTCQRPERRWRNGEGYRQNTYFYRAIQKYGWENFSHEVLIQCSTLEEADLLEKRLIACLRTSNPVYGYNISAGADGKGVMAESTKRLLSQKRKGRFAGTENPNYGRRHTPEERRKISDYLFAYYAQHGSPRKGAKVSEEGRRRMSEARKNSEKAQASIQILNQSKAKTVRCIETGTIYASAHEAARQTGFSQSNISAACRGAFKQAYGYHWEYI